LRDRANRFGRVKLTVTDPCHPNSADLNENAADGLQKFVFVGRVHKGFIALIESLQRSVESGQVVFGLFALGDIEQRARKPDHGAVRIPDWFAHALHEANRTIGPHDTVLDIVRLTLANELIVTLHRILPIFADDALDEIFASQGAVLRIQS
jgi:hypothetical protein